MMKPLVLEDGTPVKLVLDQTVSSETSHTGDLVSFEVVEDVSVSGVLVIPRGSIAWATVTAAEHKRRMGRGGKLDMNLDKVRLADGEKVLLRSVQGGKGGGHTGGMVTGIVVTSLVLWPAAPLFLLMHGKDITIPKGTAITAFTQGDAVLDVAKFTPDKTAGRFVVTFPDVPEAITQGDDDDDCHDRERAHALIRRVQGICGEGGRPGDVGVKAARFRNLRHDVSNGLDRLIGGRITLVAGRANCRRRDLGVGALLSRHGYRLAPQVLD